MFGIFRHVNAFACKANEFAFLFVPVMIEFILSADPPPCREQGPAEHEKHGQTVFREDTVGNFLAPIPIDKARIFIQSYAPSPVTTTFTGTPFAPPVKLIIPKLTPNKFTFMVRVFPPLLKVHP